LDGKSIGSNLKGKKKEKKECSSFEEPRFKLGSNLSLASSWIQATQGFSLLQMSPNWFKGIWNLDPSKVRLSMFKLMIMFVSCFKMSKASSPNTK
jgi:hypothetical protein